MTDQTPATQADAQQMTDIAADEASNWLRRLSQGTYHIGPHTVKYLKTLAAEYTRLRDAEKAAQERARENGKRGGRPRKYENAVDPTYCDHAKAPPQALSCPECGQLIA